MSSFPCCAVFFFRSATSSGRWAATWLAERGPRNLNSSRDDADATRRATPPANTAETKEIDFVMGKHGPRVTAGQAAAYARHLRSPRSRLLRPGRRLAGIFAGLLPAPGTGCRRCCGNLMVQSRIVRAGQGGIRQGKPTRSPPPRCPRPGTTPAALPVAVPAPPQRYELQKRGAVHPPSPSPHTRGPGGGLAPDMSLTGPSADASPRATRFATSELAAPARTSDDGGPVPPKRSGCSPHPSRRSCWPPASHLPGTCFTYGLANEAALKLREAAGMWTYSYSRNGVPQGPVAVTD